jgi:hypothetical protein
MCARDFYALHEHQRNMTEHGPEVLKWVHGVEKFVPVTIVKY